MTKATNDADRLTLADRLSGFSFQLRQEAAVAVENPTSLTNIFPSWPITPAEHDALLDTARRLKASDVEEALALATEYCNRLVWIMTATKTCPDHTMLARDAAMVMDDVARTLCPAIDKAVAALRADKKADKRKKSAPENKDVLRLARVMKRELPNGKTKKDIALEFADGDAKKAASLERALRRYPDLLK